MENKNDFSQGSVVKNILRLAGPMTLAQFINLLYNIIDRMYIGHLPEDSTWAFTGLGLTFPIIMLITAFTNLFSSGGAPLFAIARGKQDEQRAELIMGNCFAVLVWCGLILTVIGFLIKKPVLYLFGASEQTFPFADAYLSVYLLGTIFVMISLGMNRFINAQGFGKKGMLTVLIGAVLNIILDPVFIFGLNMGVRGAALATIISQGVSALWVLRFLTGKEALMRLNRANMKLQWSLIKEIVTLGTAGFIMSFTNSAVQVACNVSLKIFGGDIYIAIMTVINSIREVVSMPVSGITNASQPVISYNYGAKKYKRVKDAVKFTAVISIVFMLAVWAILYLWPEPFIKIFNKEPELLKLGIKPLNMYFFGFFMMAGQFTGQITFTSLGYSKQAIFFSLFRKVVIVVPLTLLLPYVHGLGVYGVFLAEPISNVVGGGACFLTMLATVWPKLREDKTEL